MTIVSLFRHRRRILAVLAATVALHLVTINWVSGRIGVAEGERADAKNVITAELRLAPPAPASVPPPAPPKPKARKPKPAPPAEEAPPAAPAPAASAPLAADGTQVPAADQRSQTDAPTTPAGVESAQAEPAPPAPAPAPASLPQWKVALPPSARFEFDVKRKDANGSNWSGSATIGWQLDGASYKATQEVSVSLLIASVNVMTVSSEGTVGEFGIAPATFNQKLRNRSATATHFNQQEQKITFSASERTVPLVAGAQDRATLLFQLAGIGRADVNQYGQSIEMLVGEDRNAQVYTFQLVGEEEVDTKMGKLLTWHLARPPKPGSYNARLDIWLAPNLDWYPVQIRNTEANGAITTQTVTRIIK
ncbi:DUF3108 domain-containing protein [Pseudoduganella violaceinigra]|uniref:DUF3108 domain-containing protein n=1 Tax=Pseudoduganella violaceinigra TaxID=246602 RepID=UPI000429CEAD|nr:DUF3108 domain-containing protein [Pseudoduganella violaceinigra]